MLGVPPRKIKSNMQYQSIWKRLEKLVPWILGSYIPIKKSSRVPGTPPLVLPIMIKIFAQRSGGATLGRPKGRLFGGL